jgi:hypothetical protein
LRAGHQAVGGFADLLKTPQPIGERGRKVLGTRPFGRRRFRQQQSRLEISEPRRHHEIVRRQFQTQLARFLDENEILVGERENGNLVEVYLR